MRASSPEAEGGRSRESSPRRWPRTGEKVGHEVEISRAEIPSFKLLSTVVLAFNVGNMLGQTALRLEPDC